MDALVAFAGHAAVALELAERRDDAERLAVLRDRDRIARDLHDLAVQRLYATGLSLEGVGRRLADRPDDAARVARAVDEIDETISLVRTTIRGLSPAPGGSRTVGVRARLLAEVDAAARALGFAPSLRMTGTVDTLVPPPVADHLVAVLRESLSNAARHAHARHVDVHLAVGDAVVLVVDDDGVGVPPDVHRSGLANLARRAADLGGTFTVTPRSPGRRCAGPCRCRAEPRPTARRPQDRCSSFAASTAACTRRSTPSFARTFDT